MLINISKTDGLFVGGILKINFYDDEVNKPLGFKSMTLAENECNEG